MCKPMKPSLICGCMSALLLAWVLLFAVPTFAHAQQATKDIDSTMTVTMQQTSNSVAATSNTTASNNKSSSTSSGKTPSTGDAAPFAILGVIVLCVGGTYCLYKSKKLSSAAQGTEASKSSRGTHVRPKDQNGTTKRVMSVAIATILAASFALAALSLRQVHKMRVKIPMWSAQQMW